MPYYDTGANPPQPSVAAAVQHQKKPYGLGTALAFKFQDF